MEHGFNGEIQRLTLLSELNISPSSSKTRDLISSSYRYGLTEGSYNAPSLSVTESGRVVSSPDISYPQAQQKGFELAINQFGPFKQLYEKLKDGRLREGQVVHDELRRFGVSDSDCTQAASIFIANLRFLDLVHEVAGNEYVRSIEQMPSETPTDAEQGLSQPPVNDPATEKIAPVEGGGTPIAATNRPALHIDIQVHIDATASAEQIDFIFASMAKHLYGHES